MPAPPLSRDRACLDLQNEDATAALAGLVARHAEPGDVIGLSGALGTGKTVFARAFINAMAGAEGRPALEVPSPTFTLVQPYDIDGVTVFHFDLYRLEHEDEALELGIEDAFADGISLIEWPERLGRLMPARALSITLSQPQGAGSADRREAVFTLSEGWAQRIGGALEHFRA